MQSWIKLHCFVPSLLTLPGLFLLPSSQLALTAVMRRWRKHTMYSGGHRAVGCCLKTQKNIHFHMLVEKYTYCMKKYLNREIYWRKVALEQMFSVKLFVIVVVQKSPITSSNWDTWHVSHVVQYSVSHVTSCSWFCLLKSQSEHQQDQN